MSSHTLSPNRNVTALRSAMAGRKAAMTATSALVAGVLGCALTMGNPAGHPKAQPAIAKSISSYAFTVVSPSWGSELRQSIDTSIEQMEGGRDSKRSGWQVGGTGVGEVSRG